jgi:hypothetical protein
MARAVATLEGDSTSLVKAISDAKKEMIGLEGGGKALSKQLKDVAGEADKAAGALVNKIGGGTAIKAIGGVAAGFTVAQTALGAFSSSMSAFASTQGAAGQQAMADLDAALNELQGQLFTAVMGTDDMQEAMDAIIPIVQAATFVVNQLLGPVRFVAEAIRYLSEMSGDATEEQKELAKAEREAKKATDATAGSVDALNTAYGNIEGVLVRLLGTKKEIALFDLKTQATGLMGIIKQAEALEFVRLQTEGNLAADRAEAQLRAQMDDSYEVAFKGLADERVRIARDSARAAATARVAEEMKGQDAMKEKVKLGLQELERQRQDIESGRTSFEEKPVSTGGGGGETKAQKEAREAAEEKARKDAQFAKDIAIQDARVAMFGQASDSEIAAYQAAAEAKKAADQEVFNAARQLAIDKSDLTFNLTQSPEAYAAELEKKAAADKAKADSDAAIKKQEAEAQVALYGTASASEIAAYQATKDAKAAADQAEFDAARARAIELGDLTFNLAQSAADFAAGERAKEKAAHDEKVNQLTAGFQEYGKLAGQQLADGEKASKIAEKLAKKALGGQISALGDKAMAEAAIFAAALNPMAIPMAAAGVAAYTAASYLGAEGKKNTAATPASAAPAAAPVNTAFNLRVDAAFADGESIARQFAMMQRNAQSRGLVPAGAF